MLPVLWLVGCDSRGNVAEPPAARITVDAVTIETRPLVESLTLTGQLDAERSVTVQPSIEGVIASGGIPEGRYARRGDVLFRLRNEAEAARVRVAEANLDRARSLLNRMNQLIRRDAGSLAKLDEAKAEVAIARAELDLARLELERTAIRAPFDGEVGRWLADTGSHVTPDTPLTRIDAIDRLQLLFGITEETLPLVREGMRVRVRVRSSPGVEFPGEIYFVSPTIDPQNRRTWVKAWVPNAERRMRPGQFANVDLELRRTEEAIVVPESAIASDRDGPFLWEIIDHERARRLRIQTGLHEGGSVEVVAGLSPGKLVVTQGIHKLYEGASVRLSPTRPEATGELEPVGAPRGEGS